MIFLWLKNKQTVLLCSILLFTAQTMWTMIIANSNLANIISKWIVWVSNSQDAAAYGMFVLHTSNDYSDEAQI